jgi:outer membrane receptor for ferrienterochelin and colicin
MSIKHITALLFLIITNRLFAQMPMGTRMQNRNMNVGRFYGKVIDANTNKPVEFAAVQLTQAKKDSVTGENKDALVTGMLTGGNGDFSLAEVPVMGKFTLKIALIGYKPYTQTLSFNLNPGQGMQQMMNAVDKDLGNIKLEPDAIALGTVNIDGSAPAYELKLDKKVYTFEKNPVATGTTAEDALKNVPSVNVDIDGNVTMRNAAPQIFVDGRPTTLSLDQIPADAIQEVEVITNPSAKYDASGGGSGILNIVLKKNRKIGYNGNIRAGVDSRGRINSGIDLNAREGKFNVFASGNFNQRKSKGAGFTERDYLTGNPLTTVTQNSKSITNGYFGFARGGIDYFIDNRNTLTLSGSYNRGQFKPEDNLITRTDTIYESSINSSLYDRQSLTERNFFNTGGSLSYKHLFPKEGKELTADANYMTSDFKTEGNYHTDYLNMGNEVISTSDELQANKGGNDFITSQIDFVNPFKENWKLEAGARAAIRLYDNTSRNYLLNKTTNTYDEQVKTTNSYTYTDQVYAAYATVSSKYKKLGYQFGLRAESSFFEGELTLTKQKFDNNFPVSLFPSLFISYKLNEKNDLQLNYTRKINRPSFFQIIPFPDYSDSVNISKGNPFLDPEFTNSVELSELHTFNRKNTLLGSLYVKHTTDLITRIQYFNYDTILQRNALISTYANANQSIAYGAELTSQNSINSWLDLTFNINAYNSIIDGENIQTGLTNEQFSWFSKLNLNFKLPKNFSIQLSGDYQSKSALNQNTQQGGGGGGRGMMGGGGGGFFGQQGSTLQGYNLPNYGAEVAVKYEFLKNKAASVTVSMSDVFATKKNEQYSQSDFFVQSSLRKRDAQVLRLNFSYRFGKADISRFKRKNTKVNTEGIDMGM